MRCEDSPSRTAIDPGRDLGDPRDACSWLRWTHALALATVTLFGAVALSACARDRDVARSEWIPVDASTGEAPLFALWCVAGNSPRQAGENSPGVVVAAWSDGRVVFSQDRSSGGAPYARTQVDPVEIARILARARAALVELKDAGTLIPDAGYTSILLSAPEPGIVVSSAHEDFEANTNLIATEHGIEALDGRDRETVNHAQSPRFRAFRAGWQDATQAIRGLIDAQAAPAAADPVRFEHRVL
jgi:hypothetical protein